MERVRGATKAIYEGLEKESEVKEHMGEVLVVKKVVE